jgi:hypothetical protein
MMGDEKNRTPEPETFCGYRRLMTYGSDSKSLFLNKLSDFGEL